MEKSEGNKASSLIMILKNNPKYSLFQLANLISRFGDSLDSIAFGWMVYDITKSALSMSLFFLINVLPNLIFSLPAGVIADRKSNKKLILLGYAGRGLVVLTLSLLYAAKLIEPWMIYTGTFINSTMETFSMPALSAIIPKIIDKKLIAKTTGYFSSIRSLVELLGVSIAGVLIVAIGTPYVILIDAFTFFIAFFIIMFIRVKEVRETSALTVKAGIKDLGEAYVYVKKEPIIFVIIVCGALTNLAFTPLNVSEVIYVKDILKIGAKGMSLFSAAISLGAILGGFYVGKRAASLNLLHIFSWALLAAAISYFVLGMPAFFAVTIPFTVIIIVDVFFLSFFVSIMNTILSAYLMQSVPQEMLGRVFSLLSMLIMIAMPLGSLLSGAAEYIGVPMLIIIASVLILISALYLEIYMKMKRL
jgi:DHA3 family macrolide efflux protein-like MFS transporter